MLDPRQEIMEMIHGVREQLNKLEMKLWDIPHHEEPEQYQEVFVAPAVGDYMHPSTPTHPCPEALGEGAYWDECCQCWMAPNEYEWDESNLFTNYHTDMTYLPEHGNVWVPESTNDWSNGYADDWYVAPTEIVEEYVEPALEPDPAPVVPEQPVDYSINEIDQAPMAPVEEAPVVEPAPEPAPEPMPAHDDVVYEDAEPQEIVGDTEDKLPEVPQYHEDANVDMYYHDEANVHMEEANVEMQPATMDGFQQAAQEHADEGNADMSGGDVQG
jgi:hypothetical protein